MSRKLISKFDLMEYFEVMQDDISDEELDSLINDAVLSGELVKRGYLFNDEIVEWYEISEEYSEYEDENIDELENKELIVFNSSNFNWLCLREKIEEHYLVYPPDVEDLIILKDHYDSGVSRLSGHEYEKCMFMVTAANIAEYRSNEMPRKTFGEIVTPMQKSASIKNISNRKIAKWGAISASKFGTAKKDNESTSVLYMIIVCLYFRIPVSEARKLFRECVGLNPICEYGDLGKALEVFLIELENNCEGLDDDGVPIDEDGPGSLYKRFVEETCKYLQSENKKLFEELRRNPYWRKTYREISKRWHEIPK